LNEGAVKHARTGGNSRLSSFYGGQLIRSTCTAGSIQLDLCQRTVDHVLFWPAFMLREICQQLFFGFVGIGYELLPRPEG